MTSWVTDVLDGLGVRGGRLGPVGYRQACQGAEQGQPGAGAHRGAEAGGEASGCYPGDGHAPLFRAHGLIVLTLEGERISAITRFVDSNILSWFGLPRALAD